MTSFFLPGSLPGMEADQAYGELRARTELRTGCVTRAARIYALSSRRDGADSETRVGARDPGTGGTVRAIFATAAGYTVVCEDGDVDLGRRQVYEAVLFD